MDTTPRDLDALLAQAGWARALARSLVRDPDRADDLVQRAWLAALRHPPADSAQPRRWLAAVMRNLARDDAREASSREAREREVARPERAHGMDAMEDAATAQARLLAAVRELSEPNRSTVWARYYEGLEPREIAKRDGVPVDTVKTRLARGLDALRKRFDREHGGDRGAWIAALIPLAGDPGIAIPMLPNSTLQNSPAPTSAASAPLVTATLTTIAMDAKLKVAAVLAVILCGSGLWYATRGDEVSPDVGDFAAPVATQLEAVTPRADPVKAPEITGESRAAIESPSAAPPTLAQAEAKFREGLVLDIDRRPVSGLEILSGLPGAPIIVDGDPIHSDANGRFRIPDSIRGYVRARGAGWVTIIASQDDSSEVRGSLCLIVSRVRDISGSVVDGDGQPVANAIAGQYVSEPMRRALGDLLRSPTEFAFEARTDAQGRFTIRDAPDLEGSINARAENRRSGSTPVTHGPLQNVVVVLPPPEAGSIILRGRVVDAVGAGVAKATVAIAGSSVRSDANGRFELPVARSALEAQQHIPRDSSPLVLRAILVGHLPARLVLPELSEVERIAPTDEFRLVLGSAPLEITGRVVDSEGEPVVGAQITLLDEDPLGPIDMEFGGMTLHGHMAVEQFLRGGLAAEQIFSDASGRFTFPGLQAREYRLQVEASTRSAARSTEPIAAGRRDVEIRLETSGARVRLAGRVVDRRGAPIGGVTLTARSILPNGSEFVSGPSSVADGDGRFAIEGVRGERFRIEVAGSDVAKSIVDVDPGAQVDDLVVTASRRAFVQVDLGDRKDLADSAKFIDARGQAVELQMSRSTASSSNQSSFIWGAHELALTDGRSDVASTAEGSYTCVLVKDGVETARIPVELGGTGVTVVRP